MSPKIPSGSPHLPAAKHTTKATASQHTQAPQTETKPVQTEAAPVQHTPRDSSEVKQLPGKAHAPIVHLGDDHPADTTKTHATAKVGHPTGDTKSVRVSSYGPGLYGNKTYNGTRLTPNTVGLAHKTLPMGTVVDVTINGKTVSAKVIDRGPFVKGREFDLTNGLIKQLGFSNCDSFGVRKVQVKVHH